jgi:hypothetical protein
VVELLQETASDALLVLLRRASAAREASGVGAYRRCADPF